MDAILTRFTEFLFKLPVILIAITVHEYAHAAVAYKCGDATARNFGRMTLNPLKHLDPIGFLCMFLAGFGWAKPVPVNARNMKKPRRDMVLVSIAGPISNILLALLGHVLMRLSVLAFASVTTGLFATMVWVWLSLLSTFTFMNLCFAIFNLLPIPPLDGSKLLFYFLPPKWTYTLYRYEKYIYLGMVLLLILGVFDPIIIGGANLLYSAIVWLVGLIPFL